MAVFALRFQRRSSLGAQCTGSSQLLAASILQTRRTLPPDYGALATSAWGLSGQRLRFIDLALLGVRPLRRWSKWRRRSL